MNLMRCLPVMLFAAHMLWGQPPAVPPAAQLADMKKLSFMVGEWKGGGSIQMGPNKQEFTSSETVASKLNGILIVIEGLHYDKQDAAKPVHNAYAVVSWDPKNGGYRFRAYTANGQYVDADATLTEPNVLEWRMEPSGMKIRYKLSVKDGEWIETGEMSRDGQQWRPFFEMKLKKVS